MTNAFPVILHHFDQSPFSEKIRVVFGLKNIAWTSVRISRIMPRPDLMPMTGGYRRTPVLQIGADIYCDTQVILRELERRFPEPTLFPRGYEGVASATAMWTDRTFFQSTVNLVFGSLADKVPPILLPTAKSCAAPSSMWRPWHRLSRKCATSFGPMCNGSRPSLATAKTGCAATSPVSAISTAI